MSPPTIQTLILEDEQDHAELLSLELSQISGLRFDITHCLTCPQAIEYLSKSACGLAIMDYWLQSETSQQVLEWIKASGQQVPVVVTTSANNEYIAASVTRAGAHRYVRKDDLSASVLGENIRQAMIHVRQKPKQESDRIRANEALSSLTPRESQIAKLIAQGMLSKQIANELGCTEGTVNLHRSHIMAKTKAQSIADLVRLVIRSED